jgi:hypothetical protein
LAGPTIGGVVVSQTQGEITWNATDALGVESSGITIDGNAVTNVSGPFKAAVGANFAAPYGALAAGTHTYVITATNDNGVTSQTTGTFVLTGPVISQVTVSQTTGEITWNAAADVGVRSTSVTLDGNALTDLRGPFDAAVGVNYAAFYSTLAVGTHTFVITVTDNGGASSQYTGTIVVGPVISQVAVSLTQGQISWNVADGGVTLSSTSVAIDGSIDQNQLGPITAPNGANYLALFGALPAGTHSYLITATDIAGNSTQYQGTFAVT